MAVSKKKRMDHSDIMMAIGVIFVIFMLIIPIPAVFLDMLIAVNLMISLMVLLSVMYMKSPAEFSVFPSLLLLTTVFRLALNVSSTRMILTQGIAFDSKIIKSFGTFVVGGNYVVGLIIFLIIVAVQFIVITKGATRISEVAARFRLDAMPQKYMAVEGELNSGMITEQEAFDRRKTIQQETDFYGSMDGASKFVKGDVTVGLLITFINVIGGIIVGTVMRGESIEVAAKTYLLFTVGDGLVSQIPALLLSTATGIIVTRSVSDGGLAEDIQNQLTGQPKIMLISAGFLGFMGVLPGFPTFPLFLIATMLVLGALRLRQSQKKEQDSADEEEVESASPEVLTPAQPELLELEIGFSLVPLVDESQGGDLLDRIKNLRRRSANELGIVVPPVRIRDNSRLSPNQYSIRIRGVEVGSGELQVDQYLVMNPAGIPDAIPGMDVSDPAFGQAARWISRGDRREAEDMGYSVVDCPSVLATHMGEVLKIYAPELITMQEVQRFLDKVESESPAVVREVKERGARLNDIQKVLQNLLRERVSISDMERILELIAEHYQENMRHEMLTEYVRQGLGMQISNDFSAGGVLKVVELDAELDATINDGIDYDVDGNLSANMDPEVISGIINSATETIGSISDPEYQNVIICTAPVRGFLHQVFEKALPSLRVMSYNEVSRNVRLEILGQLVLPELAYDSAY